MRAGVESISSRLDRGTRNARLALDDFTPTWSRHEARLPGARAGPLRRSRLRLDSAALLGPGMRGQTRFAPAALRSDNDRESVYEARYARHPRPSGARRLQWAGAGTGQPGLVRGAYWRADDPHTIQSRVVHTRRRRLTKPSRLLATAVVRRACIAGSFRCIAVPGDASWKVGRSPSPNADFWPGSGRRSTREWPRHRPVWDALLTLTN